MRGKWFQICQLTREVIKSAPDGTSTKQHEQVLVEIIWPGDDPPTRGEEGEPYTVKGSWIITGLGDSGPFPPPNLKRVAVPPPAEGSGQ